MTDKEKISAIKAEIERRIQECKDSKIESSYYDGLIFAFKEVRDFIDSLPEELVSEDLEEVSKRYALNNTPWDDCADEMQDAFKTGANWQKKQDIKLISESLEEAANKYSYEYTANDEGNGGDDWEGDIAIAFKAGSNWQKQQDDELLTAAYMKGAEEAKRQMMKDAIERTVKIDAGGYPYISCDVELYDYDKDTPLAKAGDKVKLIIVKEG